MVRDKGRQDGKRIRGVNGEVAEGDSEKDARRGIPLSEPLAVIWFQRQPSGVGLTLAFQFRASLSAAQLKVVAGTLYIVGE